MDFLSSNLVAGMAERYVQIFNLSNLTIPIKVCDRLLLGSDEESHAS